MKLITRDTDYAVKAIAAIAKGKRAYTVNELVDKLGIPKAFLRRIFQKLANAGILLSTKGKSGGFSLARKPKDIKISDIIFAFQGKVSMNECVFKKKLCPDIRTCPLRKEIVKIEKDVVARLESISIASLTGGK